jgi:putative two-component system response regulator
VNAERDLGVVMEELDEARRQTYEAHLDAVRSLVIAAEFKDRETAAHLTRMSTYSGNIAGSLGLAPEQRELIRQASPMHDVGKIGIPDRILCKAGPLDPDERAVMERHTVIGARILGTSDAPLFRTAREIALGHHERWDGRGYPSGQRGEDIPLSARICAVADFFDALTSNRPYRRAMANREVLLMMENERGRHFEPAVLGAFVDALAEVEEAQRAGSAAA